MYYGWLIMMDLKISSKEKDKVVSKKYEKTFDKSKTFY